MNHDNEIVAARLADSPPSAAELQRLYEAEGRDWTEAKARDDTDAFNRLANLALPDYDRVRKAEAAGLGIRPDTLDRAVARVRAHLMQGSGSPLAFADPAPWTPPVDGAGLLDLVSNTVRKYVGLSSGAADAIALFVMHCHAHSVAAISPILAITSPTPACGKTTLLTLLSALVPKPLPSSSISAAAIFRVIEKYRPTLLIDEADTFIKRSDEIRGLLNSGHAKRLAHVLRTTGDDHEPRAFSTWSPKIIAAIGRLHPTLDSRAIGIGLRRLGPNERVELLRADRLDQYEPIRRMAWAWAQTNAVAIGNADPAIPHGLGGRSADNWRTLFAIADTAGGDWPARARNAARLLSADRTEQTPGVMVLEDVRALYDERGSEKLFTSEILGALAARDDRPWGEWRDGKPISSSQLSRLVGPFEIRSRTIRIGAETAKGYHRSDFTDAFARYLPPPAVTPSPAAGSTVS